MSSWFLHFEPQRHDEHNEVHEPAVMAQSSANSDRIDGFRLVRRRRRWIVVFAVLCLLLAIVVSVVRSVDRPLTEIEQRMVGTWRNTTSPSVFTFHADRTVTAPGYPRGVWHIRESTLYTAETGLMGALEILLHKGDPPCELTFEDNDNISVFANGGTHKWQRVSDHQTSGTGK